jgi:hypothetical protein
MQGLMVETDPVRDNPEHFSKIKAKMKIKY